MRFGAEIILFTVALIWTGCSGGPKSAPADAGAAPTARAADMPGELPLPEVPDSLTEPSARAGYAIEHFWDEMDFGNRRLSLDTAFMEQNFANFLGLAAMAGHDARSVAVGRLMDCAAAGGREPYEFLCGVVEKYLADPNSPMRDEDMYMVFLNRMAVDDLLGEAGRLRAAHRLAMASRNRPGMKAADFAYITRDGKRHRLHEGTAGSGATLLMFYDPDCERCKAVLQALQGLRLPEGVRMIAGDVEDDRSLWERGIDAFPPQWTVGLAAETVDELYSLPALPVFYLLDGEGRVVLNDPPVDRLLKTIGC